MKICYSFEKNKKRSFDYNKKEGFSKAYILNRKDKLDRPFVIYVEEEKIFAKPIKSSFRWYAYNLFLIITTIIGAPVIIYNIIEKEQIALGVYSLLFFIVGIMFVTVTYYSDKRELRKILDIDN